MPLVTTFSPELVDGYLGSHPRGWQKESELMWRANLGHHEERGCNLDALLIGLFVYNMYVVKVVSDYEVPRTKWGEALLLCNTWNKDQYGRTYLSAENFDTDDIGRIVCEECISLEQGAHQELFNDFTENAINRGMLFWKWAHQEEGW
jgi:hypothetical protein